MVLNDCEAEGTAAGTAGPTLRNHLNLAQSRQATKQMGFSVLSSW
jgi:hypothetical protein